MFQQLLSAKLLVFHQQKAVCDAMPMLCHDHRVHLSHKVLIMSTELEAHTASKALASVNIVETVGS